jgi:predicted nucleic acid-binding protein
VSALLDTSVFIARESGRPARLDLLPEESFVCVVTKAELQAGVLAAADVETRAARLRTVESLAVVELLPIDEAAALAWATLRIRLRDEGRSMKVNDLWIAAIAYSRGLAVVTQDTDFDVLEDLGILKIIRI